MHDGRPPRSTFAWDLDGTFLVQRSNAPHPAPNSIAIVSVVPGTDMYTQHYFDARGVVRNYAMAFADGVWTLTRVTPDFSPLEFAQRFTGTPGSRSREPHARTISRRRRYRCPAG